MVAGSPQPSEHMRTGADGDEGSEGKGDGEGAGNGVAEGEDSEELSDEAPTGSRGTADGDMAAFTCSPTLHKGHKQNHEQYITRRR